MPKKEAVPKGEGKKLTPVMRQWEEAKASFPDALLFFRLGDFFELFGDDAVTASEVLGITLTSRNKGAMEELPMAGVPHHAAHGYVAKLLAAGHKVAICEQMADPSKVKGIVPRAVVRVVTPGLVTDDDQLEARENHWLAAVAAGPPGVAVAGEERRSYGLALFDLSTGELTAAELDTGALLVCELVRSAPREILLAPGAAGLREATRLALPRAVLREEPALEEHAHDTLSRVLSPELAEEAAREHGPLGLEAAALALGFAQRNTPGASLPVRRVARLASAPTLQIDETAQAHLELVRALDGGKTGTLLETVDATVTAPGARLLRTRLLAPLADPQLVQRRHDEVEAFVLHARSRGELRAALARVGDLERLAVRVALGVATPRDLGALRDSLAAAPEAARAVGRIPEPDRGAVVGEAIDLLSELGARLAEALVERPPTTHKEGGLVRDGYDAELDRARALERGGTELVLALEAELRRETGVSNLKVRYTRVFGWYIEVTKGQLSKVPASFRRKQTIAQGERYSIDQLDQLAADIESARDRVLAREAAIFEELVAEARRAELRLRTLAGILARWDVASALAEVAHRYDYVRPVVDGSDVLEIVDGRHPVVERHAAKGRFVPNDVALDLAESRLWLVTGPNMAGKSTFMRQVALSVVLAQAGSYVPARSAHIGVVDRLLSRVGASDNLARGESTFMVEMRETASILKHATRRSLVVLDEIGRGTSTYDGLAIAWAVAEHLHDAVGCRALFATHYHELTQLSRTAPGIVNVSVSAKEHDGGIVFLHSLERGPASRSYGVAVAKLAGVPESVIARARALLSTLEASAQGGGVVSAGRRKSDGQLDLFAAPKPSAAAELALETLRHVDVERTTPLDALALLAKLAASLREER